MPFKPKKKKLSFVKERKPFEREVNNFKLYNSHKWRKLRKMFLEKFPLCVACKKNGSIVKATVVDHIKRYVKGDDFYDENNWQPLCESCHNKKSGSEGGRRRGTGLKH